jgi:hypothetical protein
VPPSRDEAVAPPLPLPHNVPVAWTDRWLPRRRALLLLALILAGAAAARLLALDVPLERDEGEYAYGGQLLLQGIPPYSAAYNMKFPGIYAAYGVILAVFGESTRGIHTGLLVLNAAGILLVYLLGSWASGRLAGIVAAASYAILSSSPSVLGFAAHATHFIVVPALGGLALVVRTRERGGAGTLFAAGLLLGVAILMKQHAVFFALLGIADAIGSSRTHRNLGWRAALSRGGAVALGVLVPIAATAVYLLRSGVFERFRFWTLEYARVYATQLSPLEGWGSFVRNFPAAVGPSLLLWLLAGAGAIVIALRKERRDRALWIAGLAVCSFVATVPGFWFRPHYFIVLLPVTAMLAGTAVAALGALLVARGMAPGWGLAACATLFAVAAAPPLASVGTLLAKSPNEMSRSMYGSNPFPEAVEIASHIAAHTGPDARIAVIGSEPQIYFYSGRRSATGHIYTYGFMETVRDPSGWVPQPYARRMQEEMIRDLEAAGPEYIVFAQVETSWLARPESDMTILEWSRRHVSDHYDLVGVADIAPDGTEYRWEEDAAGYEARSPEVMYVFRKRPVSDQAAR